MLRCGGKNTEFSPRGVTVAALERHYCMDPEPEELLRLLRPVTETHRPPSLQEALREMEIVEGVKAEREQSLNHAPPRRKTNDQDLRYKSEPASALARSTCKWQIFS